MRTDGGGACICVHVDPLSAQCSGDGRVILGCWGLGDSFVLYRRQSLVSDFLI